MNYLSHFYLASRCTPTMQAGYMVGALLGDFIKGPLTSEANTRLLSNGLPPYTAEGIALHRLIDANFDRLAEIREVKRQQPAEQRRFGGILIDLAYDYLLATQWPALAGQELEAFETKVLKQLLASVDQFPKRAQRLVNALNQYSIMSHYDEKATMENILVRIGKRLNKPIVGEQSASLWATSQLLEPEFLTIMQKMTALTDDFISQSQANV